jgi:tricorn protease
MQISSSERHLAYLQSPSIFQDQIAFSSDDDLWLVQGDDMYARRLTNGPGRHLAPHFSHDGKHIAYVAEKDSILDVYLLDSLGGAERRLTFFGTCLLSGWLDENHILVYSNFEEFTYREFWLYKVNIHTLDFEKINLGPARALSYHHAGKKSVLGRNLGDPARWKRYRGGTAGHLWVDLKGNGQFQRILKNLKSNIANPIWIGEWIYFISDHEGVGNIYRCKESGRSIERVTEQHEFYVRNFQSDGDTIVYQCGADIFKLDLTTFEDDLLEIDVRNSGNQKMPRFFDSEEDLQYFTATETAEEVSVISRGKLVVMPPYRGAPLQIGDDHARYKGPLYVNDGESQHLVAIKIEEDFYEKIVRFDDENHEEIIVEEDLGKYTLLRAAKEGGKIAFTTGRNQFYCLDLQTKKLKLIDESEDSPQSSFCWSPCGTYIAYSKNVSSEVQRIYLYDCEKDESRILIDAVVSDWEPEFSKCGNYLFFVGIREFEPVLNEVVFDWCYPSARKIYALHLNSEAPNILEMHLNLSDDKDEDDENEDKDDKKSKSKKDNKKRIKIDWENLSQRVVALPIPMGGVGNIQTVENKIFYAKLKDLTASGWDRDADLWYFDYKANENKKFASNIYSYIIGADGKFMIYYSDDGLRVVSTESKPSDGSDFTKKDGWVNLDRIQLKVYPQFEWKQMYDEAWLLQKENFWNEKMSSIEWEEVYFRYLPLLEKISTRAELSDLMWEMQGELGTSHCYEFGGDYHRRSLKYHPGKIGADLEFLPKEKAYLINSIDKGDSWLPGQDSPLNAHDVELKAGDKILEINGVGFEAQADIYELLEGKAFLKVELTVKRSGEKEVDYVEISPNFSNNPARYRQWVEKNRQYVHEKTNGKIGYIHIPDMSIPGQKEFYRTYFVECQKQGLIVDVRYNGGGNQSSTFLRYLAQKVIGFDETRWMGAWNYPSYSVNGPIVALTNEHAGSDGDIFSHSFKLLGVGKLVGMRTWGGVVGIWPRHSLNDGTLTTQPEFSHWFKDVGWSVENYGTDPDVEVEYRPQDYTNNVDPQLDRAIQEAVKEARKNPPLKRPGTRNIPKLSLPKKLK